VPITAEVLSTTTSRPSTKMEKLLALAQLCNKVFMSSASDVFIHTNGWMNQRTTQASALSFLFGWLIG
jgi:hypothetical protein